MLYSKWTTHQHHPPKLLKAQDLIMTTSKTRLNLTAAHSVKRQPRRLKYPQVNKHNRCKNNDNNWACLFGCLISSLIHFSRCLLSNPVWICSILSLFWAFEVLADDLWEISPLDEVVINKKIHYLLKILYFLIKSQHVKIWLNSNLF